MWAFMQIHVTAKQATLKQDIHPCEDAAQQIIDVNTGEVKVAGSPTMLRSIAIGSCVVVASLDSEKRIGGMAHIMLPGNAPVQSLEKTKYASGAIEQMLNQMFEAGASMNDIEVCLVGAGNILQKEDNTICEDNIESVMQILKKKNIPIKALVLGGTKRKSVFLDVENGCISYVKGDEKEKTLWQVDQRAKLQA
jgi:chemotaxis protein CheD